VGASWEGFVIEQVIDELSVRGKHFDAYHFRTNDQHELDLVLDFGKELWAVEIKLTASPSIADMDRLNKTADLICASRRILVSRTSTTTDDGNRSSCSLPALLEHFQTTSR
jgi:predicted AAA+ superfamily ATPase